MRGIGEHVGRSRRHIRFTPHACGEYGGRAALRTEYRGSPPRARGIRSFPETYWTHRRFTTACAGNTLKRSVPTIRAQVHPRTRGESSSRFLSEKQSFTLLSLNHRTRTSPQRFTRIPSPRGRLWRFLCSHRAHSSCRPWPAPCGYPGSDRLPDARLKTTASGSGHRIPTPEGLS